MKRIFSLLLVLLALSTLTLSAKKKSTEQFQYDIECAANGIHGTYVVRVWTYSKKAKSVTLEQSKRDAVHGVIFKGFAGVNGCQSQRPLIRQAGAETENADYFKMFFKDGGEYMKYAATTQGTQEVVKVGKMYKVGIVVTIAKDDLRKALEAAGVLRSLNHGF